MRFIRPGIFAAALIAGFAQAPAHAGELGFYVGFNYGHADKEVDAERFNEIASGFYAFVGHEPEQRSYTTEKRGRAYGFLAGYRLTQHFAVEGGYGEIGKQSYREDSSGIFVPADSDPTAESWRVSLTNSTSGFSLSAMAILPISYSWEVYARGGVFLASNTLSAYASEGNTQIIDRVTESSTDWLAGVGIAMSLAEVYTLRAEYTRIFDSGEPVFGESDLDLFSIGVTVLF